MSMGRVRNEIFGVSDFSYRNFVKTVFRGRDPKNNDFGPFSEIYCQNFCQAGQNLFFVTKNEEMRGYFGAFPV